MTSLPDWCCDAIDELYDSLEDIDGESGLAAQIEQNSDVHCGVWGEMVRRLFLEHYKAHERKMLFGP